MEMPLRADVAERPFSVRHARWRAWLRAHTPDLLYYRLGLVVPKAHDCGADFPAVGVVTRAHAKRIRLRTRSLPQWLAAVILLGLSAPTSVFADHCGAGASVTPSSGPPGTTFVFSTNLGASSDLRIYRNEVQVQQAVSEGTGAITYAIQTAPGDSGQWRVHAEVRGQAACAADASFLVVGAPDTATEPAETRWIGPSAVAWITTLLFVLTTAWRRTNAAPES